MRVKKLFKVFLGTFGESGGSPKWSCAKNPSRRHFPGALAGTPDPSGKDVPDHMAMDVRQAAVDAVVVKRQLLVVDAEQVQDRRVEIGHGDFVFRDEIADLVARPVAKAALHPGSGEEAGERGRMMIAPR